MGIFRLLSLRQNLQSRLVTLKKLLMAESVHPESYFEIPLDVDEPVESLATNQQPQPHAQTSHRPSNGLWFTFDDIPSSKWRERVQEMSAYIDLQMI